MGKFIIKKRTNGEFQFNLKASNGQVILTSEGYTTKSACNNGIESITLPHRVEAHNESLPITIPNGSSPKDILLQFDVIDVPQMDIRVYDQHLNLLDMNIQLIKPNQVGVAPAHVLTSDYIQLSQEPNTSTSTPAYLSITPSKTLTITGVGVESIAENDSLDLIQVSEVLPAWTEFEHEVLSKEVFETNIESFQQVGDDIFTPISYVINDNDGESKSVGSATVYYMEVINGLETPTDKTIPLFGQYLNLETTTNAQGQATIKANWELQTKGNKTFDWYLNNCDNETDEILFNDRCIDEIFDLNILDASAISIQYFTQVKDPQ